MLRLLHDDVTALALVLLSRPWSEREALCRQAVAEADVAERYRRRFKRAHPLLGDGSLQSWAQGRAKGQQLYHDPERLECELMVLRPLLEADQPEAQATQRRAARSRRRRPGGIRSPQSSHSP